MEFARRSLPAGLAPESGTPSHGEDHMGPGMVPVPGAGRQPAYAGLAHAGAGEDHLGRVVQVDSIKTRVESAPGFSA